MPADAGGIKNDLRAVEGGNPRTLSIPLVPTKLHADAPIARIEIRKTQVAGREIKFFVIERIIGNMHLAVFAEKSSAGVEHRAGVVINAGGASLEKRDDQGDVFFAGVFCKALLRRHHPSLPHLTT